MHLFKVGSIFALFASLVTASTVSSAPPPGPTATGSVNATGGGNFTAQYRLYKWQGCLKNNNRNDEESILDALKEANTILGATGNYYINDHWSAMSVVEYFGNPPDLKVNNQRSGLAQNLRNAYSFTNGWWFNSETTAVYCHDGSLPDKGGVSYSTACGSSNYPDPIVVAPDYHGKDKPALLFCDSWFDLGRLADAIKSGKSQPYNGNYNLENYENRARAWITAMMLIPKIGANPADGNGNPIMRYQRYNFPGHFQHFATTAAQCKYATKYFQPGAYSFVNNPDSISWYALASYVQDKIANYPIAPFVPIDVTY